MTHEKKDQSAELLTLLHQVMERDEALRQKYEVGDKFRFVRDRLKEIVAYLETDQSVSSRIPLDTQVELQEGEVAVYVYLYNARGTLLRSWVNMLTSTVFYEYSVNRPIYADKTEIEAMLRAKTDKQQHAYLTVAVKLTDVLQAATESTQKDSLGNSLIRVREGSLKLEKLITFTHNGNDYRLSIEGEFIKKL